MKDSILVFVLQYVYVLLLGLQSLNVHQRRYVGAAITSLLLGIGGFYVTSVVGSSRGMTLSSVWWGFVLAGPAGITTAIAIHPWLVRRFGGKQ